jgi:hypothetical protein
MSGYREGMSGAKRVKEKKRKREVSLRETNTRDKLLIHKEKRKNTSRNGQDCLAAWTGLTEYRAMKCLKD